MAVIRRRADAGRAGAESVRFVLFLEQILFRIVDGTDLTLVRDMDTLSRKFGVKTTTGAFDLEERPGRVAIDPSVKIYTTL